MGRLVLSWGRAHRFEQTVARPLDNDKEQLNRLTEQSQNGSLIPYGQGRSYGDVGLNQHGVILVTNRFDKVLDFNRDSGVFRAQSGMTLDEILRCAVPSGWFLPVSPGTKFVSLGGAIANDVHGKNHHQAGSFGAHVLSFALKTSDGRTHICSRQKNIKLFNMTIGGLGLTGLILWAEIQLKKIESAYLDVENIPYDSLSNFFKLSEASVDWPYTVAWIDCFASGRKAGRGIFTRAKFSDKGALTAHTVETKLNWPMPTPSFFLNRLSISIFNWLYRHRSSARYKGRQHYNGFFYPLDGIQNWNRLYGRKGFYQYQCLIPMGDAEATIEDMLKLIRKAGQGSFLAVMKIHGEEKSPGIMSFTRPGKGVSLALDFANKGEKTLRLLQQLDGVVKNSGGRLYPAKDGRMSPAFFQESYPDWQKLEGMRDPAFQSSFWRRVTQLQKSAAKAA